MRRQIDVQMTDGKTDEQTDNPVARRAVVNSRDDIGSP